MNRRDFTKYSALALAGTKLPLNAQAPSQTSSQAASQAGAPAAAPIRYAVIGLGTISTIFMRACANSKSCKVTALVTGHPDTKGKTFAAQYNVPESSIYTYQTFDKIRDNPNVDAIYIGLPNSMHAEYTLRGAAAGKHVLCEKPMAISSAECRSMIEGCRKANVKLMIAYRIHFEPTWLKAMDMIKAGAIGQIQSFQGGFFNEQQPGAWRLDRALAGGGSIFDLGIYPLNAIRHITGEEPSAFTAVAATRDHSGRFAQMEQSIEFTLKLPSGIIASCSCSYKQSGSGYFQIHGDRGYLDFNPAFNYDGLRMTGLADRGRIELSTPDRNPYQFTLEADYFADCIRNNRRPEPDGEEGLKDLLAIESIYRAAGTPVA